MARYVAGHLTFDVHGRDALERVMIALSEVGADLPHQINGNVEEVGRELVSRAQHMIRTEPVTGSEHSGLRESIARGTKLTRVGTGRYRIITSVPQSDEAIIPRGFDRPRGWRHPVFGNRNKWVTQKGDRSWFMDTMHEGWEPLFRKHKETLEAAAERIDMASKG